MIACIFTETIVGGGGGGSYSSTGGVVCCGHRRFCFFGYDLVTGYDLAAATALLPNLCVVQN